MLAWESLQPSGDPRKLLISRFVLEQRVEAIDPLAPPDGAWESEAYAVLLGEDREISVDAALVLVAG